MTGREAGGWCCAPLRRRPGNVGALLDVEISIVNHQNRDLVRRCLTSLPGACAGVSWNTTVVDNVSGDGSLGMLADEFPDVEVVANTSRLGYGANHNQVLRRVLGEQTARYALVLNDDTELLPGAVASLVSAMDGLPRAGAMVPKILVPPENHVAMNRIAYPSARMLLTFDITRTTEPPDPNGWLQGCCLLLRVEALRQVGLFDESFFLFYEDTDLSRRLEDGGWMLASSAEATVLHVGHASVLSTEFAAKTPLYGQRSRYLYFRKHLGAAQARLIITVERAALVARAARARVRAHRHRDDAALARSRLLVRLARFDPTSEPPAVAP